MSEPLLHADQLRRDPRVAQAQRLLREALTEHRAALQGVRPPEADRQATHAALLQDFADRRGGKLFFPYLGSGLGNGALVELADGSVKFDMITGIGVHAFGHSDPELLQASLDAALGDAVMQGNLQQNVESAALCREFVELAGGAIKHCFLSTSGATANENALKMLFQKRFPADRMLAFSNCFAGRTLATSQLTDRAKNRVGLPTVLAVDYVPFFDAARPEQSTAESLARIKEHLERYPGSHAGMILELVQGEGGYYTAPPQFYRALCQLLRQHQVPIFFDEIQTFGRTTRPFAYQHFGLEEFADVVTVGKLTQVCATLFRDELVPRPGLVSQTFTGATSSIFAARSILQRLREGHYFGEQGRIQQVHARFVRRFETLHAAHPDRISGPWGLGGMLAFTAFDGGGEKNRQVLDALFAAGVIAFSAGADPTRVRMLPPFGVIIDDQIDAVCDIIDGVLAALA
jgi:acetylornithine aminotransferase